MKKILQLVCLITIALSLLLCSAGCSTTEHDSSGEDSSGGGASGESRSEYLSELQKNYNYDFVPRFIKELLEKLEEEESPYAPREYPTGVSIGDKLYKGKSAYDFWTLDASGNTGRDAAKGWYTAQDIPSSKLPELIEKDDDKYLKFTEAAQLELFYLRTSKKNTYHIFDNSRAWGADDAQKELLGQEFLFEFAVSANGPYVLGVSDFRTVPEKYLDTSSLCGINFLFDGNKISMSRYGSGNEEVVGTMAEDFNFGDGKEHLITFAMSRTSLENGTISLFIDKQQVELKATDKFGLNEKHPNYGGGKVKKGVVYLSDANAYGQRFSVIPQTKDDVKTVVEIHDYNRVWVGKTELPWSEDEKPEDFTIYPTGASLGSALRKGTAKYSFWDVDAAGNANRDATKGWYTARLIKNSALPTLRNEGTDERYLEFASAAQIELFHLEGTGKTYHIFDNQKAWESADAQKLFGQEFVYEVTVSATGSFVLGVTDFNQTPAKFAEKGTNGEFAGIHFLFDGNKIKMTRYGSGKEEAVATLASDVNFADGKERKITFCLTREDSSNGRIRMFVDEKFCSFVGTSSYKNGSVSDGVMYLTDAYLYGQRFSVIPQEENGKVFIHNFNRIKANVSQEEVEEPETIERTVELTEGLTFADGSTSKTIEVGKSIPAIVMNGDFSSVYDVTTNEVLVFDSVTGLATMPDKDLTLAPYTVECGDLSYGFTDSGSTRRIGQFVVDQFQYDANVSSDSGNVRDVTVKNDYPMKDQSEKTRLGVRISYGAEIPVGKNMRIKSAYCIEENVTYVARYTFRNFSSNSVKFKIYQINGGRTLTYNGKSFMLDVNLKSGEVYTATFEFNFGKGQKNGNILNLIVFEEKQKDFDVGFISNIVKKSDIDYGEEYNKNLSKLAEALKGKNVSVIGDSISTYRNYSNLAAADTTNSTVRNNADCYKDFWKGGSVKPRDTWWYQAISQTGMNLLVNNAYSGDSVTSERFRNGCVNLHDNTGNENDINPDIIFCYIGINNNTAGTSVEEFKAAYENAVTLMKNKYADAEIYLFTLPQNYTMNNNKTKLALLDDYNTAIRELAETHKCNVVDLALYSKITAANSLNYTVDNLHPNLMGMDVITKVLTDELIKRYVG
ncbi:MAG TPA: hypothetical protein DDY77_03125 [Clostridiales bacterium]|nr:hypothetical protein [Clostridiales bacterium]